MFTGVKTASIEEYWRTRLGVNPCGVRGVVVRERVDGSRERSLLIRTEHACVIAVEAEWLTEWQSSCAALSCDVVFSREFYGRMAAPAAATVLGPAQIGYCDARQLSEMPRFTESVRCRSANLTDFKGFQEECLRTSEAEWDSSGLHAEQQPMSSVIADGQTVAIASFDRWDDRIAHICVLVHPQARSHGYGKAAVIHASRQALKLGLIPQFRTLLTNQSAVGLSQSCGFVKWGESIAIV